MTRTTLPPNPLLVNPDRTIIKDWLEVLRTLQPILRIVNTDNVLVLERLISNVEAIMAPADPFPELEEFAPYAVDVQQFDASGTWIKPSFGSIARVQMWGGGGSGGANDLPGDNNATGGGGGAHREEWFLLSALGDTETVTIGAGGAAQSSNANGSAGGDTSFGSLFTAYGGGPGLFDAGGAANGGYGAGLTSGANGIEATPGSTALTHAASIDAGAPGGGSGGLFTARAGGDAIRGGAGGGAKSGTDDSLGGTSSTGGSGGDGSTGADGSPGQAPGGGGGGGSGSSGAGGDGRCIVTVF